MTASPMRVLDTQPNAEPSIGNQDLMAAINKILEHQKEHNKEIEQIKTMQKTMQKDLTEMQNDMKSSQASQR